MKKILVGVDGSHASLAALNWAGRLGVVLDADVVAATVFRSQESETDSERYEALRSEVERQLHEEWALPPDAEAPYSSLLLADSPHSLLDAAERENADLVVVGPEARGRFASLHIGSFAHHLAHYTDRPLAIVPESGANRGLERIVLGLDGSAGSSDAARWCAAVAATAGAHVVAAYAFKPPIEFLPESDAHSWFVTSQHELERWVGPLRDAGVAFDAQVVKETHPVQGLVHAVDSVDADLVVVGARGIGGFSGLRVGRVPLQLVHHTHVPVVMVPATTARRSA
ncbi:MAG TPA: universal stress protein [Microthrixaceae bacterium]|nr:universal stress protein [Microthrixaceae bacterium]HNI34196.1 universal stress protein [Microthrixaceae bacterium]